MKANYFMLIVLIGLGFHSCKKDKNGAENVVITFTEPSLNDTIPSWNQIHMEGTITGDGEMRGYTVSAINNESNEILFTTTYDVNSSAYNFHEHWINNLYDTTAVKVRVEVQKDDAGNTEIQERIVICLP